MRIIHRVSVSSNAEIREELERLGVSVAGEGFVRFEVDESEQIWPALEQWIVRRQAVDVPLTRFSRKEIEGADWCELMADWHHGYPQPREDTFGYRQATYDLSEWCDVCGIGMKQRDAFQMKGEPTWGKRSVLQLNWVFDEFFVTPALWADVFRPHGVDCRAVRKRDGCELETVVQLISGGTVGVVTSGVLGDAVECARCGRLKHLPSARGFFPALRGTPRASMVKTEVYFGSGASASRRVLVSRAIAHELMARNVQGASLRPVAGG